MKNSIRFFISIILVVFLSHFASAQTWDWYHKSYDTIADSWFTLSHHDNNNNYYVIGNYYDTILFPDTAFIHSDNYHGTFKAMGKYDVHGNFLKAFDIYSLPNNLITHTEMVSCSNNDLIVSGGFQDIMFCNDQVIHHGNTAFTYQPEVFIVKMDDDFNVLWADIIGGDLQDDLLDLDITADNKIAIATKHVGGYCYFLSQDTVDHEQGFVSITLIEDNKDLIWRKDIIGASNGHMSIGEDGNIHFFGTCWTDFVIDGDTTYNPNENHHPSETMRNISITISTVGEVLDKRFLDFEMLFWEGFYNEYGELYVYGNIRDTIVFENDTLIGNEYGSNTELLVKLDLASDVEWYKFFKTNEGSSFNVSMLPLQLKNNHLFLAISADDDFYINNDLISSEHPTKSFFTEIDSSGALLWTKILEGDYRIRVADIILDNCDNIFFNVFYNGNVFFDQDTIGTNSNEYYEDLYAKLALRPTSINILGSDTIVCDSILLSAPEEYTNFIWNGNLSTQNTYLVNEAKKVFLSIGDENNCWIYDTIQVEIQNGFTFNIGSDTSILLNDTTSFGPSAFEVYDSYLWSDSTSYNFIDIIGEKYGVGEFIIWLEASAGVCSYRDSLILTIEDGFGIEDMVNSDFKLYPNPTNNHLILDILEEDWMNLSYSIYNLNGKKQLETKLVSKSQIINTEGLQSGTYLLLISDSKNNKTILKKFIKE